MDRKIVKMIRGMQKNGRRARREPWWLYLVRCSDGSFYTGIAKDVPKRVAQHNSGKGARYTRSRRPVELLYEEKCRNRAEALVRECRVKALTRGEKQKLTGRSSRPPPSCLRPSRSS